MCAIVTYNRNRKVNREYLIDVHVDKRGVLLGYTVPDDSPVWIDPEDLIEIEELETVSAQM